MLNGDKVGLNGTWTIWIRQVRNVLSMQRTFHRSLSCLLHCVLQSLGNSDCLLFVAHSKLSELFETIALFVGKTCLASEKALNNSILATLVSLYEGLLYFSVLTYFSKAQIFHSAIENSQLLQYSHTYQSNNRTNVKTMDTRMRVLRNGAKTEMVASPWWPRRAISKRKQAATHAHWGN